jgi:hypothetical protein
MDRTDGNSDMARQAALERAGWVFWRVFGSQWKADPDLWWRRLVSRLDELGIAPIGSVAVSEVHTEHRIVRGGTAEVSSAEEADVPSPDEAAHAAVHDAPAPARDETRPVAPADEPTVLDPIPAASQETAGRTRRSAPTLRATKALQGVLPGLGMSSPSEPDRDADEQAFSIEEARPEIVGPGMVVALFYPETRKRRTILISNSRHAPDDNVVHVEKPLAQVLIGAAVDETVELEQAGRAIQIVVERIDPEVRAAE